jgi:hypothetical protein
VDTQRDRKWLERSLRGFLMDSAHDLDGQVSGGTVVDLAEVRRRRRPVRPRGRASA